MKNAALPQYPVNIGDASTVTGVSAKMIRHYEDIGLIPPANRTQAGYRVYSEADVHMLRFIRRARNLGFSVKQIEGLLGLWRDRRRASSKVKALAQEHVAERLGRGVVREDLLLVHRRVVRQDWRVPEGARRHAVSRRAR
jgi:DNA-binding transcriptional MerR regulator